VTWVRGQALPPYHTWGQAREPDHHRVHARLGGHGCAGDLEEYTGPRLDAISHVPIPTDGSALAPGVWRKLTRASTVLAVAGEAVIDCLN
jgi:hypothetical protein